VYRTLIKQDRCEIREYPPQKRTVKISNYEIGFPASPSLKKIHAPYMIFCKNIYGLNVALAKNPIKRRGSLIYQPSNVFGNTGGFSICLGGGVPENFDDAIDKWWWTSFDYCHASSRLDSTNKILGQYSSGLPFSFFLEHFRVRLPFYKSKF